MKPRIALLSFALLCTALCGAGGIALAAAEAAPAVTPSAEAPRLQAARDVPPETEVFLQTGHSASLRRLAWSPDGRFIATASDDATVKLWDVATRRLIYTYRGHASVVNAVAFTPDGEWLVTAGAQQDYSLHVIERRSGRLLRQLSGHGGGVQDFALLPDGRRLFSVSEHGGEAILWDLASGTLLQKYDLKDVGNLRAVAVLPDGKRAIVGGYGGHLAMVSLVDGHVLRRYPKLEREIAQIAIHPDNKSFFTASGGILGQSVGDGVLTRWPLDGDVPLLRYPGPKGNLWGLSISPDGRQVAAGGGDTVLGSFGNGASEHSVWVWQAVDGELHSRLTLSKRWSGEGIRTLAFSPDGGQLALSSDRDNALALWDLSAAAEPRRFEGRLFARRQLAVTEDGSAWTSVSIANKPELAHRRRAGGDLRSPAPAKPDILDGIYRLMRWNPKSGEREETVDLHRQSIRLLSAVGAYTMSLSEGRSDPDDPAGYQPSHLSLVVTHPEMGQVIKRIAPQLGSGIFLGEAAALSQDGMYLALNYWSSSQNGSGSGQKEFFVALFERDEQGFALRSRLPVAHPVTALAFAAEGTRLLAGVCDGRNANSDSLCDDARGVRLHCADVQSGQWQNRSEATTPNIKEIRVSPDGKFALTTGAHAIGWRTTDCGAVRELWAGDKRNTTAGAWSPDQKRLAFASAGRRIHLWNTETVTLERSIFGFDGRIEQLAFTPDGKTLLALTNDGALRLWDAATGELRATLTEFDDGEWIAVTPEGYFTGSPNADRQLNVRNGDRVYGMDQFYDVFYRPDIVRRKLAGEKIDDLIRVTIDEAVRRPPPSVALRAEAGQGGRLRLLLDASDEGGGVGELRVYHNGKLVAADSTPKPSVTNSPPSPRNQTSAAVRQLLVTSARRKSAPQPLRDRLREVDIQLAPGENRVWVTGFNADGTLGSRPITLELPSQPASRPRIFVLALGIDRYRHSKDIPTLRYAVKDAKAFASEMKHRLAKAFPGQAVNIRVLTDGGADLSGVERALVRLRKEMNPGDVFIWFIASHGMLDDDSNYNVVLHDADLDRPGRGVLPAGRIVDWLKQLPALDQLVVFDTCHAGGLDGTVRGLYDARFGVLARNMGLHVLASASATEEALDGYQGNGLFTHSLLRTMNDPASDSNRDRRLSTTELGNYARELTRSIARGMYFNQTPLNFHFGRDMVVSSFQ